MGRDSLGDLEHQVMLALLRVGEDAYTVPVLAELEARTGREVAAAAVYIALRRLEDKGLVRSETRAPDPGEGGRDRRYFEVTRTGMRKLREQRATLGRLWEGLEQELGGEA